MEKKNLGKEFNMNSKRGFLNSLYGHEDEDESMENITDVDEFDLSDEYMTDEDAEGDGEDF